MYLFYLGVIVSAMASFFMPIFGKFGDVTTKMPGNVDISRFLHILTYILQQSYMLKMQIMRKVR